MNNILKKTLRIFLALVVAGLIIFFNWPKNEDNSIRLKTQPFLKDDGSFKPYLASTSWDKLDAAYKFAVQVDDFNGDVLSAGNYNVRIVNGSTYRTLVPFMANIYVLQKDLNDINTLDKLEPTLVVGDAFSEKTIYNLQLKKNDFVYVIPQESSKRQSGYLKFELR